MDSCLLSGDADVLAGEPGGDEVDGFGVGIVDISEVGDVRPVIGEYRRGCRVYLAYPFKPMVDAGQVEGEFDTAVNSPSRSNQRLVASLGQTSVLAHSGLARLPSPLDVVSSMT